MDKLPENVPHGYVSLREYVDIRFNAVEIAVDKAESATTKRFESVNEMRSMVTDAAQRFMPRMEYETSHRALVEKVEALQKFLWVGLGAVLAIQLFVSLIFVFLKGKT